MTWIGEYEIHPAAEIFPLLDGKEYAALVEDIRENGQLEPIVRIDGRVVDGRNRLRACVDLGIAPRTVSRDELDPWDFAWSLNVERRHLPEGDRAARRLKWRDAKAASERSATRHREANNARSRTQRQAANPHVVDKGSHDVGAKNHAKNELAKEANVSPATAQKAITVHDKRPELFDAVVRGDVTLNQAYRQTTRAEATAKINAEPAPLPTGPFRVLCADPPWAYEKRKDDGTHRAALTYPTMTTEEVCAMGVGAIAHEDSVLWLWTTNAFMRDAYDVAAAWGFEVKTILTWAKDRMGTGDWLRGKTEHCLMCVRGKPVVNLTNETTLLEGKVREHSRKPVEFYEMVEKLCPGSKVEIFGREAREGWVTWGAESDKFAAA